MGVGAYPIDRTIERTVARLWRIFAVGVLARSDSSSLAALTHLDCNRQSERDAGAPSAGSSCVISGWPVIGRPEGRGVMQRTWWLDVNELDEDQKRVIALPSTGDCLLLALLGAGRQICFCSGGNTFTNEARKIYSWLCLRELYKNSSRTAPKNTISRPSES